MLRILFHVERILRHFSGVHCGERFLVTIKHFLAHLCFVWNEIVERIVVEISFSARGGTVDIRVIGADSLPSLEFGLCEEL